MENKKRMSNGKFLAIWIPILSVIVVLLIVVTVGMNMFSSVMDTYIGRGERVEVPLEGTEGWDSQYNKTDYTTGAEAKAAGITVANKVVDEGVILLKNDGVLPLAKQSTVVPFGYRYIEPVLGQPSSGGAAKWILESERTLPEAGLTDFVINNSAADRMVGEPAGLAEAPGTSTAGDTGSPLGGNSYIYEYPASIYDGLAAIPNSTALVFVGRYGQENQDKKCDAYEDGTPHYLALSQNERDTIAKAKELCTNVVLVLQTAGAMELAPVMAGDLEVDAILMMGQVGQDGYSRFGKILSGDIVPSGRTPHVYATDLTKDPSYANWGTYEYTNVPGISGYTSPSGNRYFLEYQEGVYMGYRYYETADEVDDSFVYGELDEYGGIETAGAVTYPFGYGLSYNEFVQSIEEFGVNGDTVTVRVKVENKGSVAAKEVVQLYYSAPYTDLSRQYKIEKPSVQLLAFDKVEVPAGGTEYVDFEFLKEDMASYSYMHENSNGTKGCYVLEAGDYTVSLRANSHDVIEERTVNVAETFWYDGSDDAHIRNYDKFGQSAIDPETGETLPYPAKAEHDSSAQYVAATNLFQASSDYMNRQSTILTRSNWAGTQPNQPSRTKEADEITRGLFDRGNGTALEEFDYATDKILGNVEGSLVYSAEKPVFDDSSTLTAIDLRGLSYYDETWDELLNQIDWENNVETIMEGLSGSDYRTPTIEDIGLPGTESADGVNGLKKSSGYFQYDMSLTATYPMTTVWAATFNTDLIYEVGKIIGEESQQHDIMGLYAPAVNLNRSAFCGRVYEYFSEDPVLSGKIASAMISGAGDSGLTTYIKHFALNNQETHRAEVMSVWCDEQSMRELYLKAFEIPVKEARKTITYISDENGNHSTRVMRGATGLMAAQINIGAEPGHANYALLTSLLRNEWGFEGCVISDYWFWMDNRLRDATFRAGCDTYLCLSIGGILIPTVTDFESATALNVYRNNVKNLAYAVVNSHAMNGLAPGTVFYFKMAPWAVGLLIGNIVGYALVLAGVTFVFIRVIRVKKAEKAEKA